MEVPVSVSGSRILAFSRSICSDNRRRISSMEAFISLEFSIDLAQASSTFECAVNSGDCSVVVDEVDDEERCDIQFPKVSVILEQTIFILQYDVQVTVSFILAAGIT